MFPKTGAVCAWDPVSVNWPVFERASQLGNDCIYAIVRVIVRLSHPTQMDIMLRKRLCFKVKPAQQESSASSKLLSFGRRISMLGSPGSSPNNRRVSKCNQTSVIYDVISNLPLVILAPIFNFEILMINDLKKNRHRMIWLGVIF